MMWCPAFSAVFSCTLASLKFPATTFSHCLRQKNNAVLWTGKRIYILLQSACGNNNLKWKDTMWMMSYEKVQARCFQRHMHEKCNEEDESTAVILVSHLSPWDPNQSVANAPLHASFFMPFFASSFRIDLHWSSRLAFQFRILPFR